MLYKIFEAVDEERKLITDNIVSGIKENFYIVSNYGYISNIDYWNHHLVYAQKCCGQFNNRPYVNLMGNDGTNLIKLISRIVAKTFVYGYSEGLEVNHIDGNPMNNYYKNLEWTNRSQNIRHAYDNGLIKSKLSENDVNIICKLLEENELSAQEIIDQTNLNLISDNPIALLSAIKKRKFWKQISSNYAFPEGRHDRIFSDDQIHSICKILETNPSISAYEVLSLLGLANTDYNNIKRLSNTIYAIRNHRKYTYISDKYNF